MLHFARLVSHAGFQRQKLVLTNSHKKGIKPVHTGKGLSTHNKRPNGGTTDQNCKILHRPVQKPINCQTAARNMEHSYARVALFKNHTY